MERNIRKQTKNQKQKHKKTKLTARPIGRPPNFDESGTYVLEKLQAVKIPRGQKSDKARLLNVEEFESFRSGLHMVSYPEPSMQAPFFHLV